ncbi:PilT/PilU family type 4a pilus ATPase [Candidatus Berkiella aquae]|uniref:PilT/PilU family type 4a pilus ATPase n=1 Tax=Candidatus Berkiella aquae TaxID=295108 RepID=A0AAE3HTF6_9GAMM|nr:PilT/PilU family type 4a pilus ATPase [Candidatus Berkiella aquae]
MVLKGFLEQLKKMEGSDLYLSTGAFPSIKVNGKLQPISNISLKKGEVKALAYEIMGKEKIAEFEKAFEMNMAIGLEDIGRFRVNIFIQRNEVSMVIRRIHTEIPSLESLGLPSILTEIIMEKSGLVLFVGPTGCGKSTSLASLIDYRNCATAGHIILIEDPIEYMHSHKKSIVNQREVGLDTMSYQEALKNTLRQAPDVILIGEIRSQDTMDHAIAFAETGHLCLSTLHANNANQAFERIINFFPDSRKNQLLLDLSFNIKAIISQRLIPTLDGKRIAAFEILLGTPLILSLIHRGEIDSIKEVMEKSNNLGMQTFDQSLERLYFDKKISLEDALRNADSRNNLRLKISLSDKSVSSHEDQSTQEPKATHSPSEGTSGLSLLDD